jgi:hypothetical protein
LSVQVSQCKIGKNFVGGTPVTCAKSGRTRYDFISEGDSPAYFSLIDFGLRNKKNPSFGGLGGRFVQSATNPNRWADRATVADFNPFTNKPETSCPQVRRLKVLQNDFAARADWCVKGYKEANHAPVVRLGSRVDISAKPGDKIQLSGSAKDPDGDRLKYSWWQYKEAGTYSGTVTMEGVESQKASILVPADAEKGKTFHFILEVNDTGSPILTRYQRVVVTVK